MGKESENGEMITDRVLQDAIREACKTPYWKGVYDNAAQRTKKCLALTFLFLEGNDLVAACGDEFDGKMYDIACQMNVSEWEYMVAAMEPFSELLRPLVRKFEEELANAKKREAAKDGECLRAFTVHPGWAWAIMTGVKKQEWRSFLPNPHEGLCAIHVSKSYGKAQWRREAEFIKESWGKDLIPYNELVAEWCGKVVGVCNYAAGEEDWDEGSYGWRLSKVRPLKRRIACQGALKLWKMDAALSKKVLAEV